MKLPSVKKLRRELVEWAEDPGTKARIGDPSTEIVGRLISASSLNESEKAVLGTHLGLLAAWHTARGVARALANENDGWVEFRLGVLADYWHIRVLLGLWEADRRPQPHARVPLSHAALVLAAAMAARDEEISEWLADRIGASATNGCFGRWGGSGLPGFMVGLARRRGGLSPLELPGADPSFDPYVAVEQAWEDGERFDVAVSRICDYHLEQSVDASDEHIAEFARYPFSVLAVEVLALRVVREDEGRDFPETAHPLLAPPLDRVPPRPTDERLVRFNGIERHC